MITYLMLSKAVKLGLDQKKHKTLIFNKVTFIDTYMVASRNWINPWMCLLSGHLLY